MKRVLGPLKKRLKVALTEERESIKYDLRKGPSVAYAGARLVGRRRGKDDTGEHENAGAHGGRRVVVALRSSREGDEEVADERMNY